MNKDEIIKTYLKNKTTNEIEDYVIGQPIPDGYKVVRRVYKKRNINSLMRKFRTAVNVLISLIKWRKISEKTKEKMKEKNIRKSFKLQRTDTPNAKHDSASKSEKSIELSPENIIRIQNKKEMSHSVKPPSETSDHKFTHREQQKENDHSCEH